MSYKMMLSMSADAKTIKGQVQGYLTGILYLTSSDGGGFGDVCPFARLAGCAEPCLNTAGRGAFSNVKLARLAKTTMWFNDRPAFFGNMVKSICRLIKRAKRLGLIPVVRLNGTSDLQFEKYSFLFEGVLYSNIMEYFSEVQFYDYTKIPTRGGIPSNYDLTFSYSGVESFIDVYNKAKLNPVFKRFAVVFDKAANIPSTFDGIKTLDGDKTDLRFLDGYGIVALYAKGKAKKDTSGFVVRM
jgi:hypothetical protein